MATIETTVSIPKIGLIAATRGMLGTGIGLLISDRVKAAHKKKVGWTLFSIGVLSTIPLALSVFHGRKHIEAIKP